jgi:hypothetical protein
LNYSVTHNERRMERLVRKLKATVTEERKSKIEEKI